MQGLELAVEWVHGAAGEPPLQVHQVAPGSWILRQSKRLNYEGPFLYLFAAADGAILFDTGATADAEQFPLRTTVDSLIGPDTDLVVAHTHAHGDHVAADGQFAQRRNTVVLGPRVAEVAAFFEIADWPSQIGTFELGDRLLEVFGIPGHETSSVAVFDPLTGLLLTGDTVYPGRLYVEDMAAFRTSLDRLVDFTERRPVSHLLGCHIEMTDKPGRDYPIGTTYQPAEAPLPMTAAQLVAVRDAAVSIGDRPGAHQFDDFAIFNGPCRAAFLRQSARYYLAAGRRRRGRRG